MGAMHFVPARAAAALFVFALTTGLGGEDAAAYTELVTELAPSQPVVKLDAGQFVWQPHIAPDGDIEVVISLAEQLLHVRRGGILIGVSTISSGGPGYDTPAGTFTILQKKKEHYSNLYDDAPMPYMQRLTWGGVALHAGSLPGYPASHGCIRLPKAFAELLYGVTRHGSAVLVLDEEMGSGAWLQRDLLVTSAPIQGRPRHASRDSEVERTSAAATARLNRAMLAKLTGRAAPLTAVSTIAALESADTLPTTPRLQTPRFR